ncbi:MAG: hypothetical protein NW226_14445 [Microscillaceae bacterium]|nr:hypothetical protein [Microscillaceae bacterium]
MKRKMHRLLFIVSLVWLGSYFSQAQTIPAKSPEDAYYRIMTLPTPEGILVEAGGVTTLPDGRIAVCTRRGDVWIVENAEMYQGSQPRYVLFAQGLHEPLGLSYRDNALYVAQRGELTKLTDTNGDDKADFYETIYDWPLSGHYHEYSYGPKFLSDGSMMVTGNVAFGDQEWWRGESRVPWRGWAIRIYPDGRMEPWATGMRSPCGLGIFEGEFFYSDNQGDWMGSGGIWHVKKGGFMGHPAGLEWTGMENSPLQLSAAQFYAKIDKRQVKENGQYVKPENIAEEKNPDLLYKTKESFPEIQTPAVWLPHGILGISNSEILVDQSEGKFGPFAGQLFIGDQGQSKIMRVFMEKINGEYQGAAFDFRAGFQSGVLRMSWGNDGSLYVGETNRGWGSAGNTDSGLEHLVWTGNMPFEMKSIKAKADGFEIEFTMPVDRATAEDLDSYTGRSFIYKYHPVYGSPTIQDESLKIKGVQVSEDGKKVRVVVENLRRYYIHEINVKGIRAKDSKLEVLHPIGFYTLNNIPEGDKLPLNQLSTKRSSQLVRKVTAPAPNTTANTKTTTPTTTKPTTALTYKDVEPLLVKNTCTACHQTNKKLVGPSFADIAKRKYSAEKIVNLIYNPQPQNWPDYPTPMAPMPQVPKAEAMKIAQWINTLK